MGILRERWSTISAFILLLYTGLCGKGRDANTYKYEIYYAPDTIFLSSFSAR
jgi:hypothetical protein